MYIDGFYLMLCIRNCSVLLMKSMKVYRETQFYLCDEHILNILDS